MHSVQWSSLMQAITDHHPPLTFRVTAIGTNLNILRKTNDRLSKFAHSLGLQFWFIPLLLSNNINETVDDIINHLSNVDRLPNETLVVNCVLNLHQMLVDRDKVVLLLKKIKSINPRVVTLPPNSKELMVVEQVWFGREIVDIVVAEGESKRERER
ncbi:putative transcription factor GRAS family [Helianthus anomalus]